MFGDREGLVNYSQNNTRPEVLNKESVLGNYGVDLVEKAKENSIKDIVGRDNELRDMIEILIRKERNNPIVLGETGVGKTALVYGLAHLLSRNAVPDSLQNKTIFELDMSKLISGAKYKGDIESRFSEIVSELKEEGNIILFVDEIHMFLSIGKGEGSIDIGNMLKPILANGEITVIGATTGKEYKQSFAKDNAIARRFDIVDLEPTTSRETLSILRNDKNKLQEAYGLKVTDEALKTAIELTNKYSKDKNQPEKSLDLLQEACSYVYASKEGETRELYVKRRKVNRLEMEMQSLVEETDEKSKAEILELENKFNTLTRELQQVNQIDSVEIQTLKARIDMKKESSESIKSRISNAKLQGNTIIQLTLEKSDLPSVLNEIDMMEKELELLQPQVTLVADVTKASIEQVISNKFGIPTSSLSSENERNLLELDVNLKKRVKGQDVAVKVVTETVWRSTAGIQDEGRPLGSFFLAGQTGVGKTELAKALAEQLFDSKDSLIRVDMSEYMEKHSVSRLVGSPPGYVGFEEGGQLTEQVKKNPYSIVLFDEIEKAHKDVSNILLQILDDGYVKDSQGNKIDFTNTIIILTSNLGANLLSPESVTNDYEGTREAVMNVLTSHFRPEMINRIDEIVMFQPLGEVQFKEIAVKFLSQLTTRLQNKGISFTYTDNVVDWIVDKGSDSKMGARPIRRFIQSNVENQVAIAILNKDDDSKTLSIDYVNNELTLV